jgi:hypothetical protein
LSSHEKAMPPMPPMYQRDAISPLIPGSGNKQGRGRGKHRSENFW